MTDFSFASLRTLLATGLEHAEARRLGDGPGNGPRPTLFVRHDVDVSLEHAVLVGEVEAGAGVAASFLVMVDSPLYRLDPALLRELHTQGHEVGLHVDLGELGYRPRLALDDIVPAVRDGRARLEAALGEPIRSVSFHRPAPPLIAALAEPERVEGLVNAYATALMACYLADSAGRWRHGDPLPVLADPPGDVVQLLVHPIWWSERHQAPEDRLEAFFHAHTANLEPDAVAAFDATLASVIRRTRRRGLDAAVLDSIPR